MRSVLEQKKEGEGRGGEGKKERERQREEGRDGRVRETPPSLS